MAVEEKVDPSLKDMLSILPIKQAVQYVNDHHYKHDTLADDITDIITDFIFNIDTITDGMVFYGYCNGGGEYNLMILIKKLKNIKINDKIPYMIQSSDFDAIYIWPKLGMSVSNVRGTLKLVDDNKYNKYEFSAHEYEYHKDIVQRHIVIGCTYKLMLRYPDHGIEEVDDNNDSIWSNWNEYFDRMNLIGTWDWPQRNKDAPPRFGGHIVLYRINKWLKQCDPVKYTVIQALKQIPRITKDTKIEEALVKINEIIP